MFSFRMIHKRHYSHEIWRVEEKQHPSCLLMPQVEARLSDIFIAHFCLSPLTSLVLRSSQVWNNFTCPQILLEFLPLVCHIVFSTMMKGDCVSCGILIYLVLEALRNEELTLIPVCPCGFQIVLAIPYTPASCLQTDCLWTSDSWIRCRDNSLTEMA